MIEVFKTSVTTKHHAEILVVALHKLFPDYTANFDLDDCDRILRVKCANGHVEPDDVIYFLKGFDFEAEVLPDEDQFVRGRSEYEIMMRCILRN